LYPSTILKEKIALNNNLTYGQLDWFLKRLRKKKNKYKPTISDLRFEEEQTLLFHVEYFGKNPSQKEINKLAKLIGRTEYIVL
jgi:hypothetical protein